MVWGCRVEILNFYKEWYYKEMEYTEQIIRGITFPLIVLTGTIPAIPFLISSRFPEGLSLNTTSEILYLIFIGIEILLILSEVFLIAVVYTKLPKSHSDALLPYPDLLHEKILEDIRNDKTQKLNYEDEMLRNILKALKLSTRANSKRKKWLYPARIILVVIVMIILSGSVEYLINNVLKLQWL